MYWQTEGRASLYATGSFWIAALVQFYTACSILILSRSLLQVQKSC